jgi:hypothetical protein
MQVKMGQGRASRILRGRGPWDGPAGKAGGLGDDLYRNQPFCACALKHGFNFILVCKPDSHITLYERLAFWQETEAMKAVEQRHRSGSVSKIMWYR